MELLPDYKVQCKAIIRSLNPHSEPRCTVEGGHFNFHVFIDQGIAYLCVADRLYPRRLAFSYLDELARSFYSKHGHLVESVQRPYAFLSFEHEVVQLRKKIRDDGGLSSSSSLSKLNEDLGQVHKILTKNIQDVLQRGEKIDRLAEISSHLTSESKRYARKTQDLHWQALYEKYGTPMVAVVLMILILYIWWYWL